MAGKRKNTTDQWLPPRVYRGRASYEFHPLGGGSIKLIQRPSDNVETESLKAQVWAAYAKMKDTPPSVEDLNKLISSYHKSTQFCGLSTLTQKDYLQYSKRIIRVFGHMLPDDIKPPHVRQFMDALAAQGKIVTANRHHSYLSVIFSWGIERAWCASNPAKLVRKFRETARARYIEDWEFELVLKIARSSSYPYLAPMMEIAYMCRARSIEIRKLTEADILPEGIYLNRAKGSVNEITGWSERLLAAVKEARSLFPNAPTSTKRPLFHSKTGAPIPMEAFKSAWGRVMAEAMQSGLKDRFTFHDIKAKGISDHDTKASGHKTKKMAAVYDRKPGVVPATK